MSWQSWVAILGLVVLGVMSFRLLSRTAEVQNPEPLPTAPRIEVAEPPGYSFEPPDGWSRQSSGENPFVDLLDEPPEVVLLEPGPGAAMGILRVEDVPVDVLQRLTPRRFPKGRSSAVIVDESSGVLVSYRAPQVRMRIHAAVFRKDGITFVAFLTAPPGILDFPREFLADTLATWEWADS